MALGNDKIALEQYFQDNWTFTPIQYEGVDFDSPDEWISLQFIPFDREEIGFGGACSRKMDYITIKIRSYSTNPTKAFLLYDKVVAFLECLEIGEVRYELGIADGNGAVPLHNNIYETTCNFISISLV